MKRVFSIIADSESDFAITPSIDEASGFEPLRVLTWMWQVRAVSTEVRWCTACESANAVEVKSVQRTDNVSLFGLGTKHESIRRHFRCQACGAGFELRPRGEATTAIAIDALLVLAVTALEVAVLAQISSVEEVVVGLVVFLPFQLVFGVLLAFAVRRRRMWERHRMVHGAALPELRFPSFAKAEETPRKCSCGGSAAFERSVAHNVQGIPMGKEWRYHCEACDRRIHIASKWRSMQPELVVLGVLAAAVLPMFVEAALWSVAIIGGVVAIACVSAFRARVVARNHPPAIPSATARVSS